MSAEPETTKPADEAQGTIVTGNGDVYLNTAATINRWRDEHPWAFRVMQNDTAKTVAEFILSEHVNPLFGTPEERERLALPDLYDPETVANDVYELSGAIMEETVRLLRAKGTNTKPEGVTQRPQIVVVGQGNRRYVWADNDHGTTGGKGHKGGKHETKVYVPKPVHPMLRVTKQAPPEGWRITCTKQVAEQIAGWYVGRPHTEWSALALVDTHWSKAEPKTATFLFRELFFCDAGNDGSGHSTIPAAWEAQLIDKLIQQDREDDIPKLIGHVHSHHGMGAFWSAQDDEMCGVRLDDMAAVATRPQGIAVSLVMAASGGELHVRGRLDWFDRKQVGGPITYHTWDPMPVQIKFPAHVRINDVLRSQETNRPSYRWAGTPKGNATEQRAMAGDWTGEGYYGNYGQGEFDLTSCADDGAEDAYYKRFQQDRRGRWRKRNMP